MASDFLGTDRFRIRRRLGSGGMGVVYEAHDRETDKVLALKALTRTEAADIYRFKREFRALADVSHPNLVSLYEFMSDGTFWFFTMELVRGVTFLEYVRPGYRTRRHPESGTATLFISDDDPEPVLDPEAETVELEFESLSGGGNDSVSRRGGDRVTDNSRLDLSRLRAALRQLAEGLHGLHETGKLHRDIKPSNILVTREGRVVILDFGLVADVEGKGQPDSGLLAGTPDYMSPEQGAQYSLSKASDWYSVGVILYQALTGKLPFSGRYFEVIMDKQSLDPPPPIEAFPMVPHDLNDLCMKLLRRKPDKRPSGRDIVRFLNRGKTGQAPPAPAIRPAAVAPAGISEVLLPFVGRAVHFKELSRAFAATEHGRTATVHVHGAPGMGKSTLVQRFADTLRDEDDRVVVLKGRCYERESVPYKALDGVVDSLTRYLMTLSETQAAALMPREAYALARLFPVMLQVDSIFSSPLREQETADPLTLRRRAFAALRDVLARISDRQRLVVWIDDLQWADADSTALLEELLRPPDAPALLLITSFRTADINAKPFLQSLLAQAGSEACHELRVAEVSDDEAQQLMRALIGRETFGTEGFIESIVKEARGNPFLLEQLGRYALTTDRSATTGITLGVMLDVRLDQLPKGARELMQTLAVVGRPINQEVAYQAAGLTGDELPLISSLRAAQFLRSGGSNFGIELYHDRIRETLHSQLDPLLIKQIHRRLAQALEARGVDDPESLFEHYLGADERVRAASHAAAAAKKAAAALAFDRAAFFYQRALELAPISGAEAIELRTALAESLVNAGRPAQAAEVFLELSNGTSGSRSLGFKRRAAEQLLMGGHIKEGLALFDSVLSAAGFKLAAGPKRALWSLLLRRVQIRLRGLHFVERDASQISEVDLFRIDICSAIAAGLGAVDVIRAADFQGRHLLLALRAGEPYRIARAMAFEAAQTAAPGRKAQERALKIARQAESLSQRTGDPDAIGLSLWATGVTAYCVGHWKRAAELCERSAEMLSERCSGVTWQLSVANRFLLGSLLLQGELAEVSRRVPELLAAAVEQGNIFVSTDLRTRMNLIWLANDEPDAARTEVIEALKAWPQEGFNLQHYSSLLALAQIELYTGDAEVAWKHVQGQWRALQGSLLLRLQILRVEATHLLARTALASAVHSEGKQRDRLLRIAEKLARRISKEKVSWADPFAALLRAAVASARLDGAQAAALLTAAVKGFELGDMGLYAAVGRRRLGQVLGNERGQELIAIADEWMTSQRIKKPALMTRMLAPGWDD